MGNNSRKKYSADFKAKVALEALKEQMTLPELEKKFGVSQYMISRWKRELSKNASQTFGTSGNEESHQKEVDNLHRKIGELEMITYSGRYPFTFSGDIRSHRRWLMARS